MEGRHVTSSMKVNGKRKWLLIVLFQMDALTAWKSHYQLGICQPQMTPCVRSPFYCDVDEFQCTAFNCFLWDGGRCRLGLNSIWFLQDKLGFFSATGKVCRVQPSVPMSTLSWVVSRWGVHLSTLCSECLPFFCSLLKWNVIGEMLWITESLILIILLGNWW
jgi:hypothetical protein